MDWLGPASIAFVLGAFAHAGILLALTTRPERTDR